MSLSIFLYFAAVAVGFAILIHFTVRAESTALFNKRSPPADDRSEHSDVQQPRTRAQVLADITQGIKTGVRYAVGFSIIAGIAVLVALARGATGDAGEVLGIAVVFYLVFGTLAGAVYGLLRPIRDKVWGRLITAYVILLLVYGGGTIALRPLVDPGRTVPMRLLLGLWSIVCLVLAPIYTFTFGR